MNPWPRILGITLAGVIIGLIAGIFGNVSSNEPVLTWRVLWMALIIGAAWGGVEAWRQLRQPRT